MTQPPNRLQMFRASKLARDAMRKDVIAPGSRLRIARPLDAESLIGRHEGSGKKLSFGNASSISSQLQKRLGSSRALGRALGRKHNPRPSSPFDTRQRATVKTHYFEHGGGGAGALRKHVKYLAREDAGREHVREPEPAPETQSKPKPARDLEPDILEAEPVPPERYTFYDRERDGVNGAALAEIWGREDRRHFRIILSAENGGRLGDLREYTRDVMARAEKALGVKLQWFAIDHYDTDNPHSHIVLRGVREDGRDLIMPRGFIQHEFRNLARDAATDRLGARSRNDERLALQREARIHGPTRLDKLIANQLDENRVVRVADLRAPNNSPDLTDALKARARELKNMGLATEIRRNVLQFESGWREALKAMERHLDIRKAMMRARTQNKGRTQQPPKRGKSKNGPSPFGLDL